MAKGAKRTDADTAAPYIPADPQDIMSALLRTPPPPAGRKSARTQKPKRRKKGAAK
jgi:hypothetical protein